MCDGKRNKMSEPLTVFIPIKHYHDAYLRAAIESVFLQTCPDWELLFVVDEADASHFEQLLAVPLADPRTRLVINRGRLLAGAYNSAMRAARTEFIAPLLGDDLWALNAVDVLRTVIWKNPRADFFHTGRYHIDGDGRRIGSNQSPQLTVTAEGFAKGAPVKHLLCWRTRMGLACGGLDESLNNHGSDDFDFPWLMLEHGAVFHPVPDPLYIVRDHRDAYRLTTHVPRNVQARELQRILEKHGVAPDVVRRRVRAARRGYLRQSLFRNGWHQWLLERFGFDARRGRRQQYR